MQITPSSLITDQHRELYQREGYFVLESVISDEHLQILRDSCDHLIDLMHQEMDRQGTDHIHISHRGKRDHIAKQYDKTPRLSEYVFSSLTFHRSGANTTDHMRRLCDAVFSRTDLQTWNSGGNAPGSSVFATVNLPYLNGCEKR